MFQSAKVVIAVGSCLASTLSISAFAEEIGRVVSFEGRVLMRNANAANPALSVIKAGDILEKGTVINTSSTSSAKIMLSDKTIVDIATSTLFKIDDYMAHSGPGGSDRDVSMSVDYGKIRTSVTRPLTGKGAFKVKTRTATMGVRGTEFVVNAGAPPPSANSGANNVSASSAPPTNGASASRNAAAGPTQITVIHGKVEVGGVGSAAPIALTAGGQLTTASMGADGKLSAPPRVVTLPGKELASVKAESKQPDHTFTNAVVVDSSADGSSRGGQTLAAIVQVSKVDVKTVPIAPPVGITGAINPVAVTQNPVNNQNFGSSRVRIIFHK